jgi:hypothetical protein
MLVQAALLEPLEGHTFEQAIEAFVTLKDTWKMWHKVCFWKHTKCSRHSACMTGGCTTSQAHDSVVLANIYCEFFDTLV